jgi:peptidoglycan/xylan/chitin deacetylase (PgdA/CDA1 family)
MTLSELWRALTFLFISLSLSVVVFFPQSTAAAIISPNGTLETQNGANPLSWVRGTWGVHTPTFTYPVPGRTGNGARVSLSNYGSGDAKWYFTDVPVVGGTSYTFSDWSIGTVPSSIIARYQTPSGTFSYVFLGSVPASNVWQSFRRTIVVPPNTRSMTVFHLIAQNGSLTIDDVLLETSAAPTFTQGMVTFSFDDGFQSIYQNGIPILNAAGIKSTQGIATRLLATPGYMGAAEMKAMAAQGHEIAAHTQTHADLTTIPLAQARTEIQGSRSDIAFHGITARSFIYPFGSFNQTVITEVQNAGFSGARGVETGFNTPTSNRWQLKDQHITAGVPFSTVRGWIDTAVANKQWVILEMHRQVANGTEYSNDPALLQAVVNYVKANNIKTVTLGEGIQLLR